MENPILRAVETLRQQLQLFQLQVVDQIVKDLITVGVIFLILLSVTILGMRLVIAAINFIRWRC